MVWNVFDLNVCKVGRILKLGLLFSVQETGNFLPESFKLFCAKFNAEFNENKKGNVMHLQKKNSVLLNGKSWIFQAEHWL